MRLIDADKLEDILVNHGFCYCNESDYSDGVASGFLLARDDVKEAPTIEAEPVRHGKWIVDVEDWRHQIEWFKCSQCDFPTSTAYNYCPHCGAIMDENEISNIARESADKISKALEKVRAKGIQKQNIKEDDKP